MKLCSPRWLLLFVALGAIALVAPAQQTATPKLSADDAIRIREFYRLAPAIEDGIWPGWSKVPAPLMLVTADTEFLTHDPAPPKEMKKVADDLYARPRMFPPNLQATMPIFGPPATMVVGDAAHTASKTSTVWLITLMHEHFHQLQWSQPGYQTVVDGLNLARGDTTGMWMLNYAFPYDKPEVIAAFNHLRDLLLRAVNEKDAAAFAADAKEYVIERKKFFARLSSDDAKYFSFQLWQEGIARYTEVRAAEAAAGYHPSPEFAALADYEPFASYAARARSKTLDELKQADLANWKRGVVYPFGAAEGFLLDRMNPSWKQMYFANMLSLDSCFEPESCQVCSEQAGKAQRLVSD
jgi:hypothetical protein